MNSHDSFRHQGLRLKLIEELKQKGIQSAEVLEAINRVPRHLFIESAFVQFAYRDAAFPIAAGQTISQPYTVALQTQALQVKPQNRVLEVGTGSGYQAAVLLEMGATLYTIERQQELYHRASSLLKKLHYKANFYFGDGYKGLPEKAPFEKIIVTAGAPYIPEELLLQLRVGGTMVIPLGNGKQTMTRIVRLSETEFEQEEMGECAFVPMLEGVNKK